MVVILIIGGMALMGVNHLHQRSFLLFLAIALGLNCFGMVCLRYLNKKQTKEVEK
jgi:hypothetical protein